MTSFKIVFAFLFPSSAIFSIFASLSEMTAISLAANRAFVKISRIRIMMYTIYGLPPFCCTVCTRKRTAQAVCGVQAPGGILSGSIIISFQTIKHCVFSAPGQYHKTRNFILNILYNLCIDIAYDIGLFDICQEENTPLPVYLWLKDFQLR